MPSIAVRVHRPLSTRIRTVPDDLLWPREVREHVLAAKTVDARRLREEATLTREDALPRVEEHLAPRVHHGQLVVGGLHYCVQVLNPSGEEGAEGSQETGPPRLTVALKVGTPHSLHVPGVGLI